MTRPTAEEVCVSAHGPLPLLTSPPGVERADAARNRRVLVETARRMIERDGIDSLTMDALAAESELGKGTIFRRFGSRAGLMRELVNDFELEFQTAFLTGPPPLGPGAAPLERLVAFGRARLDLVGVQGDLLRAANEPLGDRMAGSVRSASRLHMHMLLREAHVVGDLPVITFHLLAALDVTLVLGETRGAGMPIARLADGWEDLVRRLLPTAAPGSARG